MALWGNKDLVYDAGTIDVNLDTATITGSTGVVTFTTSGISTGDVVTVGTGATYGYAIVTGFTSTTISIADTANFVSGLSTVSGATYFVSQEPLYTLGDSTYDAPEYKTTGFSTSPVFTGVFGVDETEVSIANTATGDARKYSPTHAGWVGVSTYIDCHGTLRVKSETLVAMGSIVSDNSEDDPEYPNT